jgi:hypothetical protein
VDFALKFVVNLETSEFADRSAAPRGIAFHRWLPRGREDAIALETGHAGSKLVVWTERWGTERERDRGLTEVIYAVGKRELSDEAMTMQGRLSSGPLIGELITTSSVAERDAVIGGGEYVPFASRILPLLVPPIQRLVGSLQVDFGQYWLRDFDPFDSRTGSLGQFFRTLQAKASFDDRLTWSEFTPNPPVISLEGSYSGLAPSRRHLSAADWGNLAATSADFPIKSVALELVLRARELEDVRRDIRLAIVETATAAEVAVEEFLSTHPTEKAFLRNILPDFENVPAQTRFSLLAATIGGVSNDVMLASSPAWQFRHRVVHNGWTPAPSDFGKISQALAGLQTAVATLLGRQFRSLSAFEGGAIALPDRWDEPEERRVE